MQSYFNIDELITRGKGVLKADIKVDDFEKGNNDNEI